MSKSRNVGQVVVDACRKFRKAYGTQDIDSTSERVKAAIEAVYTFVVLTSDVFILWKCGEKMQIVVEDCR